MKCPHCDRGTKVYRSASLPSWATIDFQERRVRCSHCRGTGEIDDDDEGPTDDVLYGVKYIHEGGEK